MTNETLPLSGPSHAPASGKPSRQLVIFLHGYGANGDDLIGLAPFFAQALPDAAFMAPNAPEQCPGAYNGFQWFGLTTITPTEIAAGVRRAAPVLELYIDGALKALGLTSDNLALIGFSQGTMMALERTMRKGDAAAIVGFSGKIADTVSALPKDARHPPVLLVHGTADPVLPFASMGEAEHALKTAGFPVETLARPGLQHGIDQEGATRAAQFLKEHLPA